MTQHRGSYTVTVTPFDEETQAYDEAAMRGFVDWQIEQGVPGLIILGSMGEFLLIDDDERTHIVESTVDQAAGRIPIFVGTMDAHTDNAVRYSKEAEALGADGLMIISPYYSSPTEDELFEHFRRISDAVSIPIMVYNNPNTANVDLRPEFVARLGTLENVRYIKESSGDISRVREIHRISDEVSVFAGYHPFESLAAGAKGYVSVIGNFLPAESAAVCDLMDEGRHGEALLLYNRMIPLLNAIAGDKYVSATKCAMAAVGMSIGDPRPPRLALPEVDATRLHLLIKEFKAAAEVQEAAD
jgi:4-hydroxy-tetrahydrodipicolinate synthase